MHANTLPLAAWGVLASLSASPGAQTLDQVCSAELAEFSLPPLDAFDSDRSGAIEKREAQGCRSLHEVFEELDLNDDHALDQQEFSAFSTIWNERARTFGVED